MRQAVHAEGVKALQSKPRAERVALQQAKEYPAMTECAAIAYLLSNEEERAASVATVSAPPMLSTGVGCAARIIMNITSAARYS